MSSDELLARAVNGDRQALAGLLQEHFSAVRELMDARIPRRWRALLSADDIMQQTCIDAFLGLGRLAARTEKSFHAWLTSLAKCNLVDTVRMLEADKRGGRRSHTYLANHDDSRSALHTLLDTGRNTPSRNVARREACETVTRAIEQLPHVYRHIVRRCDLDGQPVELVAAELGKSPGAVYMMRSRARRRLRAIMGATSRFLTKH